MTKKDYDMDQKELNNMPTLAAIEKAYILQILALVKNNKEEAAVILGISLKTIYNKINAYKTQNVSENDKK